MNHYPHHIGDFLKDTVGLTDPEELVYRRLLESYYSRERGFSTDEAFRIARKVLIEEGALTPPASARPE